MSDEKKNVQTGEELRTKGGGDKHLAELQKRLKAAGIDSYIGVVRFAGPALKNTEKQVQFDAAGTGWSSDWPEWAYEVAREALLHNKKLWVVSAGDPFGRNLLNVLIRWEDI